MFSKFLLGRLRVDTPVCDALGRTPLDLVARHAVCDFGCTTNRRQKQNLAALDGGGEIVSEYLADPHAPDGLRVRVTTHAGWGETEVVLIKPQPKKGASRGTPV